MTDQVEVKAFVSEAMRLRIDEYAAKSGLTVDEIVETAVEEYLDVLEQIPPQYVIPRRIVLTNESFDEVLRMISEPGEPTPALVDLMRRPRPHRNNQ